MPARARTCPARALCPLSPPQCLSWCCSRRPVVSTGAKERAGSRVFRAMAQPGLVVEGRPWRSITSRCADRVIPHRGRWARDDGADSAGTAADGRQSSRHDACAARWSQVAPIEPVAAECSPKLQVATGVLPRKLDICRTSLPGSVAVLLRTMRPGAYSQPWPWTIVRRMRAHCAIRPRSATVQTAVASSV